MKYCLKKIHQYILAIFSRIIELINFIIYIIKNFNKIKFKLEKIKAQKFLKNLGTEKYHLHLKTLASHVQFPKLLFQAHY